MLYQNIFYGCNKMGSKETKTFELDKRIGDMDVKQPKISIRKYRRVGITSASPTEINNAEITAATGDTNEVRRTRCKKFKNCDGSTSEDSKTYRAFPQWVKDTLSEIKIVKESKRHVNVDRHSKYNDTVITSSEDSPPKKKKKKIINSLPTKQIQGNNYPGTLRTNNIISNNVAKATNQRVHIETSPVPTHEIRSHTPIDTIDTIEELPVSNYTNIKKPSLQSVKMDIGEPISRKVNKACAQYTRIGQQALAILNDEVSTALRSSLGNIDDIQMRIRKTIDEINECDKQYHRLKNHNLGMTMSFSSVSSNSRMNQTTNATIEPTHNLEMLITPSREYDDVMDTIISNQSLKEECCATASLQSDIQNTDSDASVLIDDEISPTKLTTDQYYMTLNQQNMTLYNILPTPSSQNINNTVQENDTVQRKSSSSSTSNKFFPTVYASTSRWPAIEEVTTEVAPFTPLTPNEDLPRMTGCANLYNQLAKEFEKSNSLVKLKKKVKQRTKEKKPKEIMAEELYIPEKRINKIEATNLNISTLKNRSSNLKGTCQFLYREKQKNKENVIVKRIKKKTSKTTVASVQDKYPNSVLFSSSATKKKSTTIWSNCSMVQHCDSNLYSQTTSNTISPSEKSGLDCYDILDEITLNDLKPFEPEYPRKDNVGSASIPVKDTFLYQLMYGSCQEHLDSLLKSQEPLLQCQSADCKTCSQASKVKNSVKNITSNEKTKKEKSVSTKSAKKSTKKALPSSSRDSTKQLNSQSSSKSKSGMPEIKKAKKVADEDIARKLRPYIFDPRMRYPTTITVMPVVITTYANPNFTHNNKKNQSGDFSTSAATKQCFKGEPKEKLVNKPVKINKPLTTTNKYPRNTNHNLTPYLHKLNSENTQFYRNTSEENSAKTSKQMSSPVVSPIGQKRDVHQLVASLNSQQPVAKTPRATGSATRIKKQITPHAMFHKHAAESCKLLKDIQMLSQKTKLETSIQNVIDMIESKIIEILASPEESHSEAFKTVEAKIVEILGTIQLQNPTVLESINETPSVKESQGDFEVEPKVKNINKLISKTSCQLTKSYKASSVELHSQTASQLSMEKAVDSDIAAASDVDYKSSNEERFVMTSSCEPKQSVKTIKPKRNRTKHINNTTEPSIGVNEQLDKTPYKITVPLLQDVKTITTRKVNKSALKRNVEAANKKNNTVKNNQVETKQKQPELEKNVTNTQEETCQADVMLVEQEAQEIIESISFNNMKCEIFTDSQLFSPEISQSEDEQTIIEEINQNQPRIKPEAGGDTLTDKIEPKIETEPVTIKTKKISNEVTSDEFLTPFMHTLTQYRKEEHSTSSILEFLDSITNITEDDLVTSSPNNRRRTLKAKMIYTNHKVQIAHAVYQPRIFYPITIYHRAETDLTSSTDLRVLFHCDWFNKIPSTMTMINEIKSAVQSYTPLSLNRFIKYDNVKFTPNNTDVICCRVEKIIPQKSVLKAKSETHHIDRYNKNEKLYDSKTKFNDARTEVLCDTIRSIYDDKTRYDHSSLLNSIYSVLFIAIFFSLTFNYTCQ